MLAQTVLQAIKHNITTLMINTVNSSNTSYSSHPVVGACTNMQSLYMRS